MSEEERKTLRQQLERYFPQDAYDEDAELSFIIGCPQPDVKSETDHPRSGRTEAMAAVVFLWRPLKPGGPSISDF